MTTPQRRSVPATLLVLLAATLSLTGCAGQAPPPSALAETASFSSAPAPAPRSSDLSGPTDTGSGQLTAQCRVLSDVVSGVAESANGNPDAALELAALRDLQAAAPPEIRSDVGVIADFVDRAVAAVKDHRTPDLEETPALQAAMRHEAEWTAAHCRPT